MNFKKLTLATAMVFLPLALLIISSPAASAQGLTIYNTIENPLAGNYFSQPFAAQQVSEFGDRAAFFTAGTKAKTVTLTMSSWACQTGHWTTGCVTTPGATFTHPITINLYNVGPGNSVGSLIATRTETKTIPYRPSSDFANCGDTRWYNGTSCFNGFAANVSFDFSSLNATLPSQVIVGIAYNTSFHGYTPVGPQPCTATLEGCPYDSLNVALVDPAVTLTAGSNPAPDDAYFNTITPAWYCDGGAGGVGIFRLDAGCWTGFKPSMKITASNVPTSKNDCKGDGWMTRTRSDGSTFKNQGDCIQYVNTGK